MMRCGGRSCRRTAVAAAASGGETMAPRVMATAHGISGTSVRTTTATAIVVRTTLTTAKLATARFFMAKLLPRHASLFASLTAGADPVMALPEAVF